MDTRDFYAILGIPPDVAGSGIREAYRHLALRYRPGLAGERSMRAFQDVIDAYKVLADPARRASYDERRGTPVELRQVAGTPPQAEPLVPEGLSLRRDFDARDPSVDEVLDRILRNFTGRHVPKSERLDALNLTIRISPELAAFGGALEVAVPVFYPCPECHGDGHDGFYACSACAQTGTVEDDEPVQVRVPPMTRDGDAFEVPLRGLGIDNLCLHVQLRVGA